MPIYLDIDALPPVYDGQEAGLLDTLWGLNRIHIPYNSHPPPLYSPTPSASATKCEQRSKGGRGSKNDIRFGLLVAKPKALGS